MAFNDEEGHVYGKKAKPLAPPQPNRNFQISSSKIKATERELPVDTSNLNEFELMEQEILGADGEIDFDKLRQLEKKGIQPLPPVDHTLVEYESFEKDFYKEHPSITGLSADVINARR